MPLSSDQRLLDLFGIERAVVQAPMAGATTPEMVIAVCNAGGLGSLPGALYSESQLRAALDTVRAGTAKPMNLNFFCQAEPEAGPARQSMWLQRLGSFHTQAGIELPRLSNTGGRAAFDEAACAVVEA